MAAVMQNVNRSDNLVPISVQGYEEESCRELLRSKDFFTILLMYKGGASARLNQNPLILYAPDMICLSSRDLFCIQSVHAHTRLYTVSFDTALLDKKLTLKTVYRYKEEGYGDLCTRHAYCQLKPFLCEELSKKYFVLHTKYAGRFLNLILKLKQELRNRPDWYWCFRARSLFLGLLQILEEVVYSADMNCHGRKQIPEDFKRLLKYIDCHLKEPITLQSLYENFYINPLHIEKLFSAYFSMSFREYIRLKRFETAKELLRFTDLSGKEIAQAIGLSSSQNFCTFFKAMSNMSPEVFRRKQNNIF